MLVLTCIYVIAPKYVYQMVEELMPHFKIVPLAVNIPVSVLLIEAPLKLIFDIPKSYH